MTSISANDTASEMKPNLRPDHQLLVSDVIDMRSFRQERDTCLSLDKFYPESQKSGMLPPETPHTIRTKRE